MGVAYLQLNRNKRSVVLDLKRDADRDAMRALLKTADIFIYSVRPAAMARLGLSPQEVESLNPQLITVSLSLHWPTGVRRSDSGTHGRAFPAYAGRCATAAVCSRRVQRPSGRVVHRCGDTHRPVSPPTHR